MTRAALAWELGLVVFAEVFTRPSFDLFRELVTAWVLASGRRTVTGMIRAMAPGKCRAHDAYHRFLRAGAWTLVPLWRLLLMHLLEHVDLRGPLQLDLDDTLFHKSGRKIDGAGVFRDAVRSLPSAVVYARGLNLVVLALHVPPPWGGEPLGLPINVRLYRKGGPSHLDLAEEMIRQVAEWLPDHSFVLVGDGAYASLAGRSLPRTQVTSRIRRDAALYALPPHCRKRRPGRPRKRGKRLPSPQRLATRKQGWSRAAVNERGKTVKRLLLCLPVLWYAVSPDRPVLLVIVRDPVGKQPDDFFFTTDLDQTGAAVAAQYGGRWCIEDTFRNVKQVLRGEDPQTWKGHGPERAAALSLWLYSTVWCWYITTQGAKPCWISLPWYTSKRTPSFADALSALRRALWRETVFSKYDRQPLPRKTANAIVEALARAA